MVPALGAAALPPLPPAGRCQGPAPSPFQKAARFASFQPRDGRRRRASCSHRATALPGPAQTHAACGAPPPSPRLTFPTWRRGRPLLPSRGRRKGPPRRGAVALSGCGAGPAPQRGGGSGRSGAGLIGTGLGQAGKGGPTRPGAAHTDRRSASRRARRRRGRPGVCIGSAGRRGAERRRKEPAALTPVPCGGAARRVGVAAADHLGSPPRAASASLRPRRARGGAAAASVLLRAAGPGPAGEVGAAAPLGLAFSRQPGRGGRRGGPRPAAVRGAGAAAG